MAKCCQTSLILCSQDIQLTILLQNGSQVNDLSIYLSGTGYTCQPLAQIFCNIDYRHCLCIFFDLSLIHIWSSQSAPSHWISFLIASTNSTFLSLIHI